MGESISSEHRCFLPQQQHSHTASVNYTLKINCNFWILLIINSEKYTVMHSALHCAKACTVGTVSAQYSIRELLGMKFHIIALVRLLIDLTLPVCVCLLFRLTLRR